LEESITINFGRKEWLSNEGLDMSSQGASGGILSLWDPQIFSLESQHRANHWLFMVLKNIPSGERISIFNIYMPTRQAENEECWASIAQMKN
jgi:hypothetical protein